MSKTFMPELPPDQRLQLLRDNCDSHDETTYYRDLTPEDMDVKREQLSDNLVKLSEFEDELTEIKEEFKGKMNPLKISNKALLTEVKTRKAEVHGTLFNIADHDNGIMETYDENGEFISSRRLRPDEKQKQLFPLRKTAD